MHQKHHLVLCFFLAQNLIMNKFSILFKKVFSFINKNAFEAEPHFLPFGIIAGIGFASYYFIWHNLTVQPYENAFLRLVAVFLCLGLTLKKFWPKGIHFFLPIYWYVSLTYTLPFFFTFMLLKNGTSTLWPMNTMIALILLILLTDWISMIFILEIGILLAWILYLITTTNPQLPDNISGLIVTYIPVILAGAFFVYKKDKIHEEKLRSMSDIAASIAHELRTPLATLSMAVDNLKETYPRLIEAYKLAKQNNLPIYLIKERYFQKLEQGFSSIETETRSAFTFIDMLLKNVNPDINEGVTGVFSITDCVNKALERYPFSIEQRILIDWNTEGVNNFNIIGNEILLTHVLFNLIKNALYYISVARKGKIKIWLEKDEIYNRLYFKDTGSGISEDALPHIFDRFYSKTYHGAGIGLTFCKMVLESMKGMIVCESKEGSYTLFILSFPSDI